MKIGDVIACCFLLLLFNGLLAKTLVPSLRVYRATKQIEYEYTRDSFIAASFKKMCADSNSSTWEADAASVKKLCTAFWPLDTFIMERKNNVFRAEWTVAGKTVVVLVHKEEK